MSDLFTAPNTLFNFAIGDTDYIDSLNANNQAIKNVVSGLDDRVQLLELGSPINAADAVANIDNLCINGDFVSSLCGPENNDVPWLDAIPDFNGTHDTYQVKWADAWFFKPDVIDGLDVQTVDVDTVDIGGTGASAGIYPGLLRKMIIMASGGTGGTGAATGVIFQRLDYFYDLERFKGRLLQFAVLYEATRNNEFHLEIDDGVNVTSNVGESRPAGTASSVVRHIVDPNATKLTLRIVLDLNAFSDQNQALKIVRAYGKLGTGLINLSGATPPQKLFIDYYCAKLMAFDWIMEEARFGAHAKSADGTLEYNQSRVMLQIPHLSGLANDRIEGQALADINTGEPADIAFITTASPIFNMVQTKRHGPNYPTAPSDNVAAEVQGLYEACVLTLERDLAGGSDPSPSPSAGFYTDFLAYFSRVIPNA